MSAITQMLNNSNVEYLMSTPVAVVPVDAAVDKLVGAREIARIAVRVGTGTDSCVSCEPAHGSDRDNTHARVRARTHARTQARMHTVGCCNGVGLGSVSPQQYGVLSEAIIAAATH